MPEWKSFNINDPVRVKLTEVGMAEYRRQAAEVRARLPEHARDMIASEPKLDADGYCTAQMWDVMQTFGHLCGVGRPQPFAAVIQINADDLQAVEAT